MMQEQQEVGNQGRKPEKRRGGMTFQKVKTSKLTNGGEELPGVKCGREPDDDTGEKRARAGMRYIQTVEDMRKTIGKGFWNREESMMEQVGIKSRPLLITSG